jgi:imidazolonepropionase-like amidohydrolase
MNEPKENTIDEIFADGTLIDLALKQAVQEALLRHKQAGNPVVAWRDGKIVWIPPEEIAVPEDEVIAS